MPNALQQSGSQGHKPTRYAPIYTNRWITGLWTNRNELRDAATPYLYEKFYAGSRFESLLGGVNAELSSRLTLWRRPGNSVYNSQNFPSTNRFYGFRISGTSTESIRVLADTPASVFDATGPNTKTKLVSKSFGAGQTAFESVGNTLFMGNGVDSLKWLQSALSWISAHSFSVGDFIVDANNNLQAVTGILATITSISVNNNVLTVVCANNFSVGALVSLAGIGTATFLNGTVAVITSASATQFTVTFNHANYGPTADTGTAAAQSGTGTSGNALPAFGNTQGAAVTDGSLQWTCRGSSVQKMGIAAPAKAPQVSNAVLPSGIPAWSANTWFSPNLVILDSNNNLQLLTTGGVTGGSQPAWNAALNGVTNDNTAQWTNIGSAAWLANHAYSAGAIVAVSYSKTVLVPTSDDSSSPDQSPTFGPGSSGFTNTRTTYVPVTTNYSDFFKCTTPGVSGGSAPSWQPGIGTVLGDNTVQWTNIGTQVTWANIGAGVTVSTATQISDSNGNLQKVTIAGKSGGAAPAWTANIGDIVTDGTVTWTNNGPSGQKANSKAWTYYFAFKNSLSGEISTASPASAAIILAAGNFVQVQGNGSTDAQVDTIRIYRTVQGGSTPFFLAEITAPAANQTWQYADTITDPGLNEFIEAATDHANDPPSAGLSNLIYHAGRMWGSKGNVTSYSGGADTTEGNGLTAFTPTNNFKWNSRVLRHVKSALGLIVFTVSSVNIILGKGTTDDPFVDRELLGSVGLLSYNALTVNGSLIYFMDARKRVISLDPSSGVTHVGFPIADQFKILYDPSQTYCTWHTEDGTDDALYVADGSTGWFRLNPTPAPESGLTWSPQAQIVGGCKAVQSVETSPGLRKLLLGPAQISPLPAAWSAATAYVVGNTATSAGVPYTCIQNNTNITPGSTADGGNFWSLDVTVGPILFRDPTQFQDNGSSYTWNAQVGAITLAQPGQVAELEFIAVDTKRIGSRPAIGVRLDEISGPFFNLPVHKPDPAFLPASTSLYSERWPFSAQNEPAFCKHLQIQFAFPAENFQNELLTYTIFGAHRQEK